MNYSAIRFACMPCGNMTVICHHESPLEAVILEMNVQAYNKVFKLNCLFAFAPFLQSVQYLNQQGTSSQTRLGEHQQRAFPFIFCCATVPSFSDYGGGTGSVMGLYVHRCQRLKGAHRQWREIRREEQGFAGWIEKTLKGEIERL